MVCINPCFARLFIKFSKTVLAVQWILNQLESSINLHYWGFAIWISFKTQVYIVGFLNGQSSIFTSLVFSSQIQQFSRFYSQHLKFHLSVNLFVYSFIQWFNCGKLVNIYILGIHCAWLFDVRLFLFVLQPNWLRLFS